MADNTQVASATGDSIRDKDRSGVKTQVVGLDVGIGTTTEALMSVSNPAPTRLADGSGGYLNRAYGPVRVSAEEQTLFLDTHDQTIDTTNRWVTGTGTNAPAVSGTVLTFGTATTASAFGKLPSQPSFSPQIPGFLQPSFAIKLDAAGAAAISGHRFWGIGTSPATPATTSAATKLTDAIGWEIDTDGKLYAVVYNAGARTAVDLSASGTASQQLDGAYHRYLMQIRTDRIYWFIDGLSAPVATQSFVTPSTQTLPILLQTINPAASVATGGYPLLVQGSVVADTAGNSTQLSDGQYPWRKATIKPASTAVAVTDLPIAVGLHPTSPLPAGTNALGNVGQTWGTAGRTSVAITANAPTVALTGTAATETLLSLQYSKGLATNTTGVTTYAVASGKTFRVQEISFTARAGAATATAIQLTVRGAASGAISTTSPVLWSGALSVPATATQATSVVVSIPDGMELPALANIGISYNQTTASVIALSANITGFEY